MGYGGWKKEVYASRSTSLRSKSREEIFQKSTLREDFDPKGISIRESCDSDAHPNSNAIILALDVTGSMGNIAEHIAKEGLGTLVNGILDRKPVSDPHIMIMAIGDIRSDRAPLQVSQFETDIKIADQLQDLYLEGNGGGNNTESYELAWAFAAQKTKIDCFDKRGVKGYLFTFGDEDKPVSVGADLMESKVGLTAQGNASAEDFLAAAQEKYHVFHLIVEEGSYIRRHGLTGPKRAWEELLGKRVILLKNHNHISEVILAVIEVNEGADPEDVIAACQGEGVQDSVRHALFGPSGQ